MYILRMELVPQGFIQDGYTTPAQITFFAALTAFLIFLLLEVLEWGNAPQKEVPFEEQYPAVNSKWILPRLGGIAMVGALAGWAILNFGYHFQADVHHNLAIFFSKQSIWRKEPRYDAQLSQLPPDIRDKYTRWGGALEHYDQVNLKNPHFPMARYFTGNVFNDWGSQMLMESENARSRGDMGEAQRFREKAQDMWNKSEKAYGETKELAPNYVQTHHQMGLLFVKRAEAANRWGESAKAQEYYDKALHNFELYHLIDPVFPPNYERLVQILIMRSKYKEAAALYRQAVYNNDVVSKAIRNQPFQDRVASLSIALAKLVYTDVLSRTPNPFSPLQPEITEAVESFKKALEVEPNNVDALKGLGFMYNRMGKQQDAQALWTKALQFSPNDPELKANVQQR